MVEILGFAGAVLIGVTLGLIGAGGSILTVPILVYVFKIPPVLATAYSLFIVGSTSLIGSVRYMRKNVVDFRTALLFALPALTGVFLSRRIIVPAIPDILISYHGVTVTKNTSIMVLFAIVMLLSSTSMIRSPKLVEESRERKGTFSTVEFIIVGCIVGLTTGLVGVGGGFLIIPALVLIAKLPIRQAIGTSLLIIAINSLIGFTGDLLGPASMNGIFLMEFAAFAIVGIVLGTWLSHHIPDAHLKPVFGWFVLAMSTYIIVRELFL